MPEFTARNGVRIVQDGDLVMVEQDDDQVWLNARDVEALREWMKEES